MAVTFLTTFLLNCMSSAVHDLDQRSNKQFLSPWQHGSAGSCHPCVPSKLAPGAGASLTISNYTTDLDPWNLWSVLSCLSHLRELKYYFYSIDKKDNYLHLRPCINVTFRSLLLSTGHSRFHAGRMRFKNENPVIMLSLKNMLCSCYTVSHSVVSSLKFNSMLYSTRIIIIARDMMSWIYIYLH